MFQRLETTALLFAIALMGCPAASPPSEPAPSPGSAKGAASQPARGAASQPAGRAAQAIPPTPAENPFAGKISTEKGLEGSIKPTDVLFIMAREGKGDSGPGRLIAVQRHAEVTLPLDYEMSAKNLMLPGIPFKGPFQVSARLDRDGDPMTRGADDLYAQFSGDVAAGQKDVNLILKKGAPPKKAPASQPTAQPKH